MKFLPHQSVLGNGRKDPVGKRLVRSAGLLLVVLRAMSESTYSRRWDWDIDDVRSFMRYSLGIASRVINIKPDKEMIIEHETDGRENRTRIASHIGTGRSKHTQASPILLTWKNIPTTTAPARLVCSLARLALGSFPPRSLHPRLRHALTGCVRPRAAMTAPPSPISTPDAMAFGACYPERSDSHHAPVIMI